MMMIAGLLALAMVPAVLGSDKITCDTENSEVSDLKFKLVDRQEDESDFSVDMMVQGEKSSETSLDKSMDTKSNTPYDHEISDSVKDFPNRQEDEEDEESRVGDESRQQFETEENRKPEIEIRRSKAINNFREGIQNNRFTISIITFLLLMLTVDVKFFMHLNLLDNTTFGDLRGMLEDVQNGVIPVAILASIDVLHEFTQIALAHSGPHFHNHCSDMKKMAIEVFKNVPLFADYMVYAFDPHSTSRAIEYGETGQVWQKIWRVDLGILFYVAIVWLYLTLKDK